MSDTKQNQNSEWRDRELGALWVRLGSLLGLLEALLGGLWTPKT